MSGKIDEYGTPSWVVLTTEDTAAADLFYGELLGWQRAGVTAPGTDAHLLRGRAVGGISPKTGALRFPLGGSI
jgi:predicted enzyme related to lactoylglutathione lyase